jgi:hypothetical protein
MSFSVDLCRIKEDRMTTERRYGVESVLFGGSLVGLCASCRAGFVMLSYATIDSLPQAAVNASLRRGAS